MRNGNNDVKQVENENKIGFLSYLWGMETQFPSCAARWIRAGSYPTYEEWKLFQYHSFSSTSSWFLSYLWGMETSFPCISVKHLSRFLSYLWGMETWMSDKNLDLSCIGSYPTYEEWKPKVFGCVRFIYNGSYPTYEEWKHFRAICITSFLLFGSYPTYEEWKLSCVAISNSRFKWFLSYLWGMETSYQI